LAFCIDEGVMLTAYSLLAVGDVSDDETLTAIKERYNKSAA
jgi:diketogulonate reductase-like aldo/keto reductase